MYNFLYDKLTTSTSIDFVDVDNSTGGSEVRTFRTLGSDQIGILRLADFGNAEKVDFDHTGFDITTTGAIELSFFRFEPLDLTITLYDGATRLVLFTYDGTNFDLDYDRGAGLVEIYDGSSQEWLILSIRIDVAAGANGTFDCFLYDANYSELANVQGIEFENNATTVDRIRFETEQGNNGDYYIDAVGITAEGGYILGDIQYTQTDVSSFMFNARITDGILPLKKRLKFNIHPDNQVFFTEDNYLYILDDLSSIIFAGIIRDKSQLRNGIYSLTCDGLSDEIFDRTHDKSYSSDDTDTKLKDLIDNALEYVYRSSSIVGTTTTYSYEYNRSCAYLPYLARFLEREVLYIEAGGLMHSKAYDGLTATGKSWNINSTATNITLINIPNIDEVLPGFFKGDTGVSSVVVRYKDNATAVRPAAPSETFRKKRLKEYRDNKLQAVTEANQLGDNLFDIFSATTIFLNLRVVGEGWLQPGETVEVESTGTPVIAKDDFLILQVEYDPIHDTYISLVLSDNIITPREFTSLLDTSKFQIHTSAVQTFENQAGLSPIEGYLGIGIANKRWINCILEGAFVMTDVKIANSYRNAGAGDVTFPFGVPLPNLIGDKRLVITQIKIGVEQATVNDFITLLTLNAWSDHNTVVDAGNDGTNRTAAGEYTYNITDVLVGTVYERIEVHINCTNSVGGALRLSYVQVEYYYT
jgi:hypothetical protein